MKCPICNSKNIVGRKGFSSISYFCKNCKSELAIIKIGNKSKIIKID